MGDHIKGLPTPPASGTSNRLRIAAVWIAEWRELLSQKRQDFRQLSFLKPVHAETTNSKLADTAPLQIRKSAARFRRFSRIVATN